MGAETRDHLINRKLSFFFSAKLLHDLSDPELWKWHEEQSPTVALLSEGVWKQVLVFFSRLAQSSVS